MLYKNVFVPRVNSYTYILISSLISCYVIQKWNYCTSHYNRVIPRLHQSIRVVKTSKLLQFKSIPWYIFPLGVFPLTPYPYSRWGGLFGNKYNQHNLIPRHSGNSTPPTVNPLIVRVSHQTSFHTYNLLTLITIHIN